MSDGEFILPRVQLSQDSTYMTSIIDMENISNNLPDKIISAGQLVADTRKEFNTGRTKSYEFRKNQLMQFKKFLQENEEVLCKALYADLRKSYQESTVFEIDFIILEINHILSELKEWMKPEKPNKPLINFFDKIRIYSDPLGVVLVMGAWNYPLLLTAGPVLGAIAAGNCCIIKPSDLSSHTSQVMADLLPKYLDKKCYPVYLGGIPETTDLLKERFDYIFYTGSTMVGKIIHKAAANYLTPCTLELGGKSPTYIDPSANISIATRRIVWGRLTNAGQTCVAPDYILCNKEVEEEFLKYAEKYIKEFFSDNIKSSKDYGRIINERNFIRICNLLKNQKIVYGGNVDAQNLYIGPTILCDVGPNDDVMKEEIFGPIFPIVTVRNAEEAVKFINEREKPLALYVFANNQKIKDLFLENTTSGGLCINDTIMQLAVGTLPFGGVGYSGMGSYHGKRSFDTFVHKKAVLLKTFNPIAEKMQELRYPPYSDKITATLRFIIMNFNKSINIGKYLRYGSVFALGVGVTIGGFYIKRHFSHEDKI